MALTVAVGVGWWIGYAIGVTVVIVVGVLLLFIIATADQIANIARDATSSLTESRDRTEALWQVSTTNELATEIGEGARAARKALGG